MSVGETETTDSEMKAFAKTQKLNYLIYFKNKKHSSKMGHCIRDEI